MIKNGYSSSFIRKQIKKRMFKLKLKQNQKVNKTNNEILLEKIEKSDKISEPCKKKVLSYQIIPI